MMRRLFSALIVVFFLQAQAHAQGEPLTLKAAYQLALKRSEQLSIRQQQIKEAEGRFLQALSGALPKASFDYDQTYRQGGNNSGEGRFTFRQTLFSGFKEFAAMTGSRAERRQRSAEELRARQVLFTDVADAFYFYGLYQEQVKSTRSIAKALSDRMEELEKRTGLGRSRTSELATAEFRLRRAEADVEQLDAQMVVARELLEFMTGVAVTAIQEDTATAFAVRTDEELIQLARERPDVKAAGEAVTVAEQQLKVARAGSWPSVTAEGNYYTKKASSSSADWDAVLKVSVPLFTGGENRGKSIEASALAEQARLALRAAERQALLELRQAYAQWQSSTRRYDALKKAMEAAERNYDMQTADYRNSLVNNLDVLQSLQDLEGARLEYIQAANDMKRLYWQYKISAGELNDGDL